MNDKLQISSTNFQIMTNCQNFNNQIFLSFELEAWNVFGIWRLVFVYYLLLVS